MMNAESWFHCASVNGPGEWGLGMLVLVLVEGIHPLAKLNSRFLTLTDRKDEDGSVKTPFLFGVGQVCRRACQRVDP